MKLIKICYAVLLLALAAPLSASSSSDKKTPKSIEDLSLFAPVAALEKSLQSIAHSDDEYDSWNESFWKRFYSELKDFSFESPGNCNEVLKRVYPSETEYRDALLYLMASTLNYALGKQGDMYSALGDFEVWSVGRKISPTFENFIKATSVYDELVRADVAKFEENGGVDAPGISKPLLNEIRELAKIVAKRLSEHPKEREKIIAARVKYLKHLAFIMKVKAVTDCQFAYATISTKGFLGAELARYTSRLSARGIGQLSKEIKNY